MGWALECDPCTDLPNSSVRRLGDALSVLGLAVAAIGPAESRSIKLPSLRPFLRRRGVAVSRLGAQRTLTPPACT
jgi:hypothetical protein